MGAYATAVFTKISEACTWGFAITKSGLGHAQTGILASGQYVISTVNGINGPLANQVAKVAHIASTPGAIAIAVIVVCLGSFASNKLYRQQDLFGTDQKVLNIAAKVLGGALAVATGAAATVAATAFAPSIGIGAYVVGGVVTAVSLLCPYGAERDEKPADPESKPKPV